MSILGIIFGASRARIGGITIDAALSETITDSSDVTENPVEQGAKITDHVQIKPKTYTIRGVITDTPINYAFLDNITGAIGTIRSYLGGTSRSIDVYNQLIDLQNQREPLTVTTGVRVFTNMILQNLTVERDAQKGKTIHFTAEMREIRIAGTGFLASLSSIAPNAQDIGGQTVNRGVQAANIVPPPNPVAGTNVVGVDLSGAQLNSGAGFYLDKFAGVRL